MNELLDSFRMYATKCRHCGGNVVLTGSQITAKGTCDKCGSRLAVHIDPTSETRGTIAPTMRVAVQLSRPSPSATELMSLRKLIPEWRDQSVQTLKARLASRGEWELGRFPDFEVDMLWKQARELGVRLTVEPERVSLWQRIAGPSKVRLEPVKLTPGAKGL